MSDVEIEYCVPCGHLDRAQAVQRDILDELGLEVDGVRLKTGDGGVFKIRVDDELVYDKQSGEELDVDAVVAAVRSA